MKKSLRISCAVGAVVTLGLAACSSESPDPAPLTEAPRTGTVSSAYSTRDTLGGGVVSFFAVDDTTVYTVTSAGGGALRPSTFTVTQWTGQSPTVIYTGTWMASLYPTPRVQVAKGAVYLFVPTAVSGGDVVRRQGWTWVHVDSNVQSFQPIDGWTVYVEGTDGKLWRENGDWTNRTPVDTSVQSFQALDFRTVLVETGNTIYEEGSSGRGNGLVSGTQAIPFRASGFSSLDFLDPSATLWNFNLETGTTTRTSIDQNVKAFFRLNGSTIFVEGTDGKLWREYFSHEVRDFVDGSVASFQPTSEDVVYVLGSDGNMWREHLSAPFCSYNFPPNLCFWGYVEAWAVPSPGGACPNIAGMGGVWKDYVRPDAGTDAGTNNGVPNDHGNAIPNCHSLIQQGGCCTYVWYPNPTTPHAQQDSAALCGAQGLQASAIIECDACIPDPDGGDGGDPKCGHPFGGGCDTCTTTDQLNGSGGFIP
jgi:hypothetical protein